MTARQMLKRFFFVLLLLTVPFAEWKTLVLPINGKVFGWDASGFGSASFFDLVFLGFFAVSFSDLSRYFRNQKSRIKSALFLIPLILLLAVLPFYRPVSFPWMADLTPAPVGFRPLFQHAAIFCVIYYYVLTEASDWIVSWLRRYWIFSFFIVLAFSLVTLAGHPYFEENYPFQPRFTLSFPFWNQNLMAPFVSVITLGLCGLLLSSRKRSGAIGSALAFGFLILGAGLTGSRSNLVLMSGCVGLILIGRLLFSPSQARGALVRVLAGCAIGCALLLANLNWEPIARSVSLFQDILKDPKVLIYGDPKGARGKIWAQSATAIAHAAEGPVTTNQQTSSELSSRVSLVSVTQGCIKASPSIGGLKVGTAYFLRVNVPATTRGPATLEVFADSERKHSLGKVELQPPAMRKPGLLLSGMQTEGSRRQRFKFEFTDYKLAENGTSTSLMPLNEKQLVWNDLHYRHDTNVQTGHLRLLPDGIRIEVTDSTVNAHVNLASAVATASSDLQLDYRFKPNEIGSSVEDREPFVAVGFYEHEPEAAWNLVKNGLFVRHTVSLDKRAQSVVMHNRWRALTFVLGRTRFNRASDNEALSELAAHFSCRGKGSFDLANLEDLETPANFWLDPSQPMPPIWRHIWGDLSQENSSASTALDDDWSVSDYLAGGSSTLSVYRDWWVFAGKLPLLLFLAFILLLNGKILKGCLTARHQRHVFIALILGIQTLFLSVYLYPQPFIFVKFYWLTWALAAGLAQRIAREEISV